MCYSDDPPASPMPHPTPTPRDGGFSCYLSEALGDTQTPVGAQSCQNVVLIARVSETQTDFENIPEKSF